MQSATGVQCRICSQTAGVCLQVRALTDRIAIALFILFTVTFSTLTLLKHDGFGTRALDLAKFDQAIWNTAQGRPYRTTLSETSAIQSHFSPALALYAPLFWIWPDVRLLFVAQAILMAGAGFLIYRFMRDDHPWLGLAVYAAYLMHPSLHQVTLVEFRRLTLAMFATSLALSLMLKRRHGWMVVALAVALLCKEDLAFTVICVGLYVWLAQRAPKFGIPLVLVGGAYMVLVPFVVLPALNAETAYRHAGDSFGYLASPLDEILPTLIEQPGLLFTYILRPDRLWALVKFLWPTVFLFALAPEIAAFMVPTLAYLLASTADSMGRLEDWYPSILLICLFWAVAVGVQRLSRDWRRPAAGLLLVASAAGWLLYSPLWPGAAFKARNYEIVLHDRLVRRALQRVPSTASVAAQDALVPHLAHRQEIYLYPWITAGKTPDVVALDLSMGTYPLSLGEYTSRAYDYLASVNHDIVQQVDNFYLFQRTDSLEPRVVRGDTWGSLMTLTGYSADIAGEGTRFEVTMAGADTTTMRVTLLWRMENETHQNLTVFVHILDGAGRLLDQHDGWPADSHRPTSVLFPGSTIRDIHTLSWSGDQDPATLLLRIGIYDSNTGEPLLLPSGEGFIVVPVVE